MFREITSELIKWKDKASRKPLLMLGVRQCGKTYIIKEFARDHFNVKLNENTPTSKSGGMNRFTLLKDAKSKSCVTLCFDF